MTHYLAMVEDRLKKLDEWIVRRGTRKENLKADALANIVHFPYKRSSDVARLSPSHALNRTLTNVQYLWSGPRLDAWHRDMPPNGEITRRWKVGAQTLCIGKLLHFDQWPTL